MGWKGTVRSIGAAIRAAERDAKRRQREYEKRQQQYRKMQELERTAYEVEEYEEHIQRMTSIHIVSGEDIDWNAIASTKPPQGPPQLSSKYEDKARHAFDVYKPGLFDKMLSRGEKKRESLKKTIDVGKHEDKKIYEKELQKYQEEFKDWEESSSLAKRVLAGDKEAQLEAINKLNPFTDISELGSHLTVAVDSEEPIQVTLHLHGDEVIPKESKSLLKSGKLTVKKMPKGQFFELYQDYTCSCVLRVANEMFSLLPIESVIVTAVDKLLNTQTGHIEEVPVLSVYIPRETFMRLNLNYIDPSDSLGNFLHNMDFKKTKGFGAVERVKISSK